MTVLPQVSPRKFHGIFWLNLVFLASLKFMGLF